MSIALVRATESDMKEIWKMQVEAFKDLLEKYNFSEMLEDEVYPIVEDEDEKEFFDYIYSYLLEIKEFYKKTIEKELAILFYIS